MSVGKIVSAVTALTLMVVGSSPLAAQLRERRHEGFWIGFGLGGGRNLTTDIDGSELTGGGAYLRMGGTPSEQILIGGEVAGWTHQENGVTLTRGNGTFTVLFYPERTGDFFFKAGVGGSSQQVSVNSGGGSAIVSESGAGESLGAGIDIQLGRNVYLTPNLDFLFQQFSSGGTTVHNTIGLITIGLTWH